MELFFYAKVLPLSDVARCNANRTRTSRGGGWLQGQVNGLDTNESNVYFAFTYTETNIGVDTATGCPFGIAEAGACPYGTVGFRNTLRWDGESEEYDIHP
eukprot:1192993-Prorocentrum_minimum.AAC.3